jgi:hypothetical protein
VNPARRRFIAEEVQRRYHRDIRNPDILSNAQVLKEVQERGEWSPDMQKRLDTLQDKTTREMGALWSEGLTPETTTFASEILSLCERYKDLVEESSKTDEEKASLLAKFDKWVAYVPGTTDPVFAGYEPLTVHAELYEESPSTDAVDYVNAIEEAKDKQRRLIQLAEDRLELMTLQLKHVKIFADTAESRRDHTEEMAQLYYTCDRCSADGKSLGKLAKEFDELWNFPDDAIRWLLYESYFFAHDVPDEARSYLATYGFTEAARRSSSENDPTDGSPAPQNSKVDGTPSVATPADSGA